MTLDSSHPNYKSLLYQLLAFLIDKKLSEDGKGISRPISIALSDFRSIVQSAGGSSAYENLKSELEGLAEEELDNGRPLFKILNPEVLDNLEAYVETDKRIRLQYKRENLEKYLQDMAEGDKQSTQKGKLYFNEISHKFRFNGKEMVVKKGRGNTLGSNIRLNLCLLLFGYKNLQINMHRYSIREFAERYGEWKSVYSGYEPGNDVELDFLKIMLLGLDEHIADPMIIEDRPVADAIDDLNERAEIKLKTQIFHFDDRTIRVLHQ